MALVDVDSWTTEFESCTRLNRTLLSQLNQRENKASEYNHLNLAIEVGIKQYDRELKQLQLKLNEADRTMTTEFESCNRLNRTLLSQLNQRENKDQLSSEYNRLNLAIQVGIKQYDRELKQLQLKLNEADRTISLQELQQRQKQLDSLETQRLELQRRYNNSANSDRIALLQNPSTSNVNEDIDDAPIIDTHDVQALKQHQIVMLEEQNRGLETLSQSISRQKLLATQLGQEVEEQNDILDNLANTMERVETGVSLETRNIGLVNRRDSTWGYWLIIIILLIAILIVAVL